MTILTAVLVGGGVTLALLMASGTRGPETAAAHTASPSRERPITAPGETPATSHTWNTANRDWVGNQRNAVAFELLSDNKVEVWQRRAQPILVVRCVAKRTEAFVFIESAAQIEAQGKHTVHLRVDDGPELTERWPDSDDHDALFAPDGAAFAQQLMSVRTLQFAYTPHNAPRVVAQFHVSGLGSLIEPAGKQCGWSK